MDSNLDHVVTTGGGWVLHRRGWGGYFVVKCMNTDYPGVISNSKQVLTTVSCMAWECALWGQCTYAAFWFRNCNAIYPPPPPSLPLPSVIILEYEVSFCEPL